MISAIKNVKNTAAVPRWHSRRHVSAGFPERMSCVSRTSVYLLVCLITAHLAYCVLQHGVLLI